jgi:hypothetical protein
VERTLIKFESESDRKSVTKMRAREFPRVLPHKREDARLLVKQSGKYYEKVIRKNRFRYQC